MSKILRVDTKEKTYTYEDATPELAPLGGRALTSRLVLNEVPPPATRSVQ